MKAIQPKAPSFRSRLRAKLSFIPQKIEKLSPNTKKQIISGIIVFSLLNFAYSLFSIYTLLTFCLLLGGIGFYFSICLSEIRKKGLIAYLPMKYRKMLLQRSVFDVLCDMWFIPRLSYIKAVATPFFIKIEPTEAINQLRDLPPITRKAILTKGIINVLPNFAKDALLPQNELVTDESDTSSVAEESREGQKELAKEENDPLSSPCMSREISIFTKGNQSPESRFLQTSTDDDNTKKNQNLTTFSKSIEPKRSFPSLTDLESANDRSRDKSSQNRFRGKKFELRAGPKVEKKFLHDSESGDLRSDILSTGRSSIKKPKEKIEASETWDKLELFVKKHRETLLKQKLAPQRSSSQRVELKGALQTLQNIATLFSKEGLMDKLENKKLIKMFLVSTAALLVQFSISKKTRYWCYHTLNILMYITGFVLSTGSMVIMMIKMKEAYRKWKENRTLAIKLEASKKEDEGDD